MDININNQIIECEKNRLNKKGFDYCVGGTDMRSSSFF